MALVRRTPKKLIEAQRRYRRNLATPDSLAHWQLKWEQYHRAMGTDHGLNQRAVQAFIDFMGDGRRLGTIGPNEIVQWERHLKRNGKKTITWMQAVRGFFGYMQTMQAIDFNPVPTQRAPRPRGRPFPVLTSWQQAITKLNAQRAAAETRVRILKRRIEDYKARKERGEPFPIEKPPEGGL